MRPVRRLAITLLLLVSTGCSSHAAPPRAPEGTWQGQLAWRGTSLECSVRFRSDGDSLRAWFNSPDLLLLGMPLDSVRFKQGRIRFKTIDDHPIAFEGTVTGDLITGTVRIGAVPGVVESGAGGDRPRFTLRRTVVLPPPYALERVTFRSDSVELGGTVYLPEARPHTLPGVVILQGSSANLRDAYHFYADHFARTGFAVLVFDKRGHGESGGDYGAATYEDLAADAAAAVARLRSEPHVASGRVGLWGLSQGAFIAPMVARRVDSLAFVVAVSPPGMVVGLTSAYQDSVRLVAAGFGGADANAAATLDRRILAWLGSGQNRAELAAELDRVGETPWRRASSLPRYLPGGAKLESWYWRGRTLDPLPSWRALRVPALVVAGEADELLPGPASAAAIEKALVEGGNADHQVKVYPDANHVLRTLPLVAGGAWDWPRAAPGYLDLVTRWMTAHARPKP
ncbi:MAG TPA: alpha/beta fold hydrolase [Methylomirabilota bacterium]|nr:alpha/beta fold hydrolase [Methylomirabilota bacterium]